MGRGSLSKVWGGPAQQRRDSCDRARVSCARKIRIGATTKCNPLRTRGCGRPPVSGDEPLSIERGGSEFLGRDRRGRRGHHRAGAQRPSNEGCRRGARDAGCALPGTGSAGEASALTPPAATVLIPDPSPCGGQVAQLVEQRTENPRVGGSIPPLATIKISHL